MPWFTSTTIMQHGPTIETPFALERYRGGAVLLIVWDENGVSGRSKQKLHEELAELTLEYQPQGLLVLGAAVDESLIRRALGNFAQRGPIVVITPDVYASLGPIEPLHRRRLVIAPDGTVSAATVMDKTKPEIAKALAERTPYGRWVTLQKPWFSLLSTVSKARALQEQINSGGVGAAMTKARRYADSDKDAALVSESRYIIETCEKWIAQAVTIEAEALAIGDPYTASLIDSELADILRGADEADAAKERLKIATADPAYKDGKAFHALWAKTWTMNPPSRDKTLRGYAEKNTDTFYGQLAASWLSDN